MTVVLLNNAIIRKTILIQFQDERYSMLLLVPQDQNAEITIMRDLPFVSLTEIFDLLDSFDIALTMPKFDLDYNDDMVEPLKNVSDSKVYNYIFRYICEVMFLIRYNICRLILRVFYYILLSL